MPAKRRPAARKKTADKKTTQAKQPEPVADAIYTDDHGIRIMGDSVEVWVSCEAKMSREYQSCGVQKGIKFKTPREDAYTALDRAMGIVKDAVKAEVDHIKEVIEAIVDA